MKEGTRNGRLLSFLPHSLILLHVLGGDGGRGFRAVTGLGVGSGGALDGFAQIEVVTLVAFGGCCTVRAQQHLGARVLTALARFR